jgi:hypothetical protein
MKYKNIKTFIPALLFALGLSFSSCVNDLNVTPIDPSVTQTFNQDQVFAKIYSSLAITGQTAPSGDPDVVGVDEGFSAFYRSIWNVNELTTDEALWAWNDTGIPELQYNSWSSSNLLLKGLYGRLYFNITLCNHFLEQTAGKDDAVTKKQRAETRFMRALNYFYLLDMFDNVPFTETVTLQAAAKPIKRIDLFKYVDSELAACEPDMYQVGEAKPYYRVNVVANWLLRSRLFLNAQVYTGTAKWDSAAIYAAKVIGTDAGMPSSGYSLCPTYRQLFMGDNAGVLDGSAVNKAPNEIIFPIAQDGIQTVNWGGSEFLIAATHSPDMPGWGISSQWSCARARAALVKKFFPGSVAFSDNNDLTTAKAPYASQKDARALFLKGGVIIKSKLDPTKDSINTILRTMGIISNTFTQGYSVIKFSNLRADGGKTHDTSWPDMDIPFMRQAEAYLTYAEAVYNGAAPSGGLTAVGAINILRTRAGKTVALTTLSKQNIIDEWAREFFFEGRRRMDLIRFGQYGGQTSYIWDWENGVAAGAGFDAKYNIFPIPATDVNANPNLTPTPGY